MLCMFSRTQLLLHRRCLIITLGKTRLLLTKISRLRAETNLKCKNLISFIKSQRNVEKDGERLSMDKIQKGIWKFEKKFVRWKKIKPNEILMKKVNKIILRYLSIFKKKKNIHSKILLNRLNKKNANRVLKTYLS